MVDPPAPPSRQDYSGLGDNATDCDTSFNARLRSISPRRDGKANRLADAPPFWHRHSRTASATSVGSGFSSANGDLPPSTGILLEDHSEDFHEQSQACWAKSATIDEYVVVSGPSGIGAYVVWHCTVSTLKGGSFGLRKRYSEFDQLRNDLVTSFPHAEAMIPSLPRKSVVSRFRQKFLEQRREGLSHFLNCVLLNPEFAASPILRDFIFNS
ncbi:PX-domain-containing protein [Polychaeton citri CBS 116435]|uniref:Endosomal/vacuolar adapter protein YPT35 n=1 Tax=Polychaeton citri CBS 116435 TaxID=1314669 RepID=A0A9P4PZM4_9PEZI|nr:PX-domain-containing protein [Polychaeton citri CBS 116435]